MDGMLRETSEQWRENKKINSKFLQENYTFALFDTWNWPCGLFLGLFSGKLNMDYHRNVNSSKLSNYYLMPLILFDKNTGTVPKSNVFSISAKFHVSIPFLASSFLARPVWLHPHSGVFDPGPTWSHIIKQLWGKLIPSESLVFHTFQFKAITHSGLLLQRGLCQAPHHCPPPTITSHSQGLVCHPSPEPINLTTEGFFQRVYFVLCPSPSEPPVLFILFPACVVTTEGTFSRFTTVIHHFSDSIW